MPKLVLDFAILGGRVKVTAQGTLGRSFLASLHVQDAQGKGTSLLATCEDLAQELERMAADLRKRAFDTLTGAIK